MTNSLQFQIEYYNNGQNNMLIFYKQTIQFLKMDMDHLDHVLKFQANEFPIETDSYLGSNCVHEFKIQQDEDHLHLQGQCRFKNISVNDVVEELKLSKDIIDLPICDLLHEVKEKYELNLNSEEQIFHALKKKKLIMKRERAKGRKRERRAQMNLETTVPSNSLNLNIVITEQEQKRKKNRISAQISRDKKKQYFNNLIIENQNLKKQKTKLQKDNYELKNKFGENLIEIIMNMSNNTLRNLTKLSKFKGKKLQILKNNLKQIQGYAK